MVQINNLVKTILTVSLLLTMVTPIVLLPKEAAKAADHKITDLSLEWATGIISDGVGPAGIIVEDLDKDGITDVVSSSLGSVYVLNETTAGGDYYTKWYSENLSCTSLTTGDRDGNGIKEIYIGSSKSMVYVFRADTFERIGEVILPSGTDVKDIAITDVDNDGSQEIIVTHLNATLVYNANTLNLEWDATGKGGNKLGIGDIDGDLKPEIVVNNRSAGIAHVLNAQLQTEKWAYAGGFGIDMDVGDVDGDGVAEIAYVKDWDDAYVFEADTFTDKWHLGNLGDLESMAVADVDLDGKDEVLIGNGQWGSVRGYRGSDGVLLWSISNPQHGVFGIGLGDADNDGTTEILWGAGLSDSGKDMLYVGDWTSQTIQWASADLDGPLYVAAGDIDSDGQVEIVMASHESNSGYNLGTIYVYNGATHQIEWSTTLTGAWGEIHQLAVGQLDNDPALEILIGYDKIYDPKLITYDGLTHNVEWESAKLPGVVQTIIVKNIDDDPVDEIITGLINGHVMVFNGASPLIQWDSGQLDGYIRDLDYGDLDGDNVTELAVLTSQSVYIYEVGTWTPNLHQAITMGSALAITNSDSSGPGELIIATSSQIAAWDGVDYQQIWQSPLNNATINTIASADLDGDGDIEFVLMGEHYFSSGPSQSLLIVASQIDTPYLIEYENNYNWDSSNGMALADMNKDGQEEVIISSLNSIQVYSTGEAPPQADFTATPISSFAPLTIQFNDQSTGNISSWLWDFDNNGTTDSTEQNPSHTYTDLGIYTVSLTVTGLAGTDTETKIDYIPVVTKEEAISNILNPIQTQIIEWRGLSPITDVNIQFMTRAELEEQLSGDPSEEDMQEIITQQEIFILLDMMEEGQDLYTLMLELKSGSTAGFYNSKYKELTLITDEALGLSQRMTFAHEYTHALQDQHFDLTTLRSQGEGNSDISMAILSLIEGDAETVQGTYYWLALDDAERAAYDNESDEYDAGWLEDIPDVLIQDMIFPYTAGQNFVYTIWEDGGLDAVNDAYINTPQSTEQILHPEKYLAGDEPQAVTMPDLEGALGGTWSQRYTDVLGELYMILYLNTYLDMDQAKIAAEGWGGDRLVYLKDSDNNKVLAIKSVWDSSGDATEFFNTYIAFMDEKSAGTWDLLLEDDGIRQWRTAGSFVSLSQTGEDVLITIAPDEAITRKVLTQFPKFDTTPQADFSASLAQITAGQTIVFTDTSAGFITEWQWDFDNDGTVDSTEQNPSHTYQLPGKYTISLKVTGAGGMDTEIKSEYITAYQMPQADFSASLAQITAGQTIVFTDISAGNVTGWQWDFDNDGTVDSTEQNPSHVYVLPGKYTVSLKVTGAGGMDTKIKSEYITAYQVPQADFSASLTQTTVGQAITFNDISAGNVTGWQWDFDNDGTVDSTEQNPSYTYNMPGIYTVSLKVTGPGGESTEIKSDYITVVKQDDVDGSAEEDSGGEKGSGFLDCSCGDSGKEETSTTALLTGWSIIGFCWGGGYYMVRRKGQRRK